MIQAVKKLFRDNYEFALALMLTAFWFLLIHDSAGGTLFTHELHDSYTLQAMAWLRGEVFLADGQNYPWLELAVYQGAYYVSFPPLPSLFMLPLVLVFGEYTPNNFLIALYAIAALTGAYRASMAAGMEKKHAIFWAVFAVFACNMTEISTNGGVWLQAQVLNFALLMWSVDCALRDRKIACCVLIALAVGCRPFSVIYIPVALIYFAFKEREKNRNIGALQIIRSLYKPLLFTMAIGAVYMWYNWIRFGNVLEFGHNYLPEFIEAEHGQFHISYLWNNLYNIFCRPVNILPTGELDFPMFDGFMFYVVNPIFIAWLIQIIRDVFIPRRTSFRGVPVIKKRFTAMKAFICAGIILNLICLCLHKTFAGWQFGARYTLDMIPFVFFYILLSDKKAPKPLDWFLCGFGILFNVYGAFLMRTIS